MKLTVDSRVRIAVADLDKDTLSELRAEFAHSNPQHYKLKAQGYKAWNEPRIIQTSKIEGNQVTFPRGGFKKIRLILAERGYSYEIEDCRQLGDPRLRGLIPDYCGHVLRPYQLESVEAFVTTENTLMRSGTGSGKTSALLAFAAKVKLPTLVIVWMSSLYEQWMRRIGEELGMKPWAIGEIRGGVCRFGAITVAMQQTLWNRLNPEIINFPGTLIVDEVHRAAARTLREIVDAFPSYYRIGASDDERRKDSKEFLIYDSFGHPAKDIRYDELADQGHVIDVDVICVPTQYDPPAQYWEDRDFNVLLKDMTVDASRNQIALNIVQAAVKSGEQVFVMSHRVQHCKDIVHALKAMGIRAGLLIGSPKHADEFDATRDAMEAGTCDVGVGTIQSIGTGLDLPKIGVAIVMTPIAGNETTFRQARGRICRVAKGKDSAQMWILMDPMYKKRHVKNLMKWSRRVSVVLEQNLIPASEWIERQ